MLFILVVMLTGGVIAQNDYCDSLYESVQLDEYPTYGINDADLLKLFNEDLLPIIMEAHSEEPPTSFRMKLVINGNDEVVAISEIRGEYPEEVQAKLLAKLKERGDWKSGKVGNNRVCSEYYFVVGCIMWK